MTRGAAAVLVAGALAGCATPTWPKHAPGSGIPADRVILVGSFVAVPPIEQRGQRAPGGGTWVNGRYEPPGHVVFVGDQAGHVAAVFTPDRSEPWQEATLTMPFSRYDWSWIPMVGAFAIEVPRQPVLHLRGFFYLTDGGSVRFELPADVELRADDRIVYVGEVRVVRTGDRRILFNDRAQETRRALGDGGFSDLAAAPWRTRLFHPPREADAASAAGTSR